jgi:heme exporter protein D
MTPEQWNQFMTDYGPFIWFTFLTFAIITVIVKAWPLIKATVKTVETLQGLDERLKRIESNLGMVIEKVYLVQNEVTLNSGTSLKDAITRIEKRLNDM